MTNSPSYLPSGYCSSSASLTANSPMGVVRRPTVNGPFLPRMVRNVSWPGTTMGRTDLVGADVAAMMVLLGKRSEEHTSELQSLMRISYAVFCLKNIYRRHTMNKSTHS